MPLLRGKSYSAPFLFLTLVLFLFGRKKPPREEKPVSAAQPFPVPDVLKKTVTDTDVTKAREKLRVSSLERDIIGDALTRIYEAEAKGLITEADRNQLVQRYKVDLKRVDGEIDVHKKVVDLHELESAKEDLLKSFHEKLLEIDARINEIKPTLTPLPFAEARVATLPPLTPKVDISPVAPIPQNANREKPAREKPKNKAEERLEAIREEVLKAMERLEQIETES